MKLSFKIFLGICIPLIIALIVISNILINKSFSNDVKNETLRAVQEFHFIEENVENSFAQSTSEKKTIIESFDEYYKENKLFLLYFEKGIEMYSGNKSINLKDSELLDVRKTDVKTQTKSFEDEHYIILSTRLYDNSVLIYARNIDSIYNIRNELMNVSIILIISILIVVAIIAYIISKTLTKPLRKMQSEMNKLAKGNFDIHLKENKSEIGLLAKSFNKMSEELKNRDEELLDLVNSKQEFIDNLSHEINTPLTTILGYTELLERADCTEEQRLRFLLNIKNETLRIKNIHKDLLLLSYKKNSDFDMKLVSSDIIFDNVKQVVNMKISDHSINLEINNRIKEFYGDQTLIVMCISNLISNAINASKDGSNIIVDSYEDSKNVYVKVIDEGQGISKENIDKIIEPFYRVDKARSRMNGGAGLGLAICTSIMKMHKGIMKIESELGVGSTFYLEFPKNLQL